jgi:phosphoribosylanthranilate isomerase
MQPLIIKAGPIKHLTDARYFAALNVTWLSFVTEKSHEDYCEPRTFHAIREWVEGVEICGESSFSDEEKILSDVSEYGLNVIQVGPFTSTKNLKEITSCTIVREIVIDTEIDLESIKNIAEEYPFDYLQLSFVNNDIKYEDIRDGKYSLSLKDIEDLCKKYSILLDWTFHTENFSAILSLSPAGICVRGGEEEKTGMRSYEDLDELMEMLNELNL